MLTEPDLNKKKLIDAVAAGYGVSVRSLEFLPIGADARSFSYDCHTTDHRRLYLKVRLIDEESSNFFSVSMRIAQQVVGAIHPIANPQNGMVWIDFEGYKLMMFPFVSGIAGWDIELTENQWFQVGKTFRSLHDLVLPNSVACDLPRENYSEKYRNRALRYVNGEIQITAADVHASAMQSLLKANRNLLLDIVKKAQALSLILPEKQLEFVCCHGDLHSGNFLITEGGSMHPVDWDNLSLAPKEKDLMFIGGGIGGMLDGNNAEELFARGYGPCQICVDALRYFRLERIVQDVVAFCEQLLDSAEGGPDRPLRLEQFSRLFEKGGVMDVAYKTIEDY